MKKKAEVAERRAGTLEESNELLAFRSLGMSETPEDVVERLEYIRLIRKEKLLKIRPRMTDSDSVLPGSSNSSGPPKDDRNYS